LASKTEDPLKNFASFHEAMEARSELDTFDIYLKACDSLQA